MSEVTGSPEDTRARTLIFPVRGHRGRAGPRGAGRAAVGGRLGPAADRAFRGARPAPLLRNPSLLAVDPAAGGWGGDGRQDLLGGHGRLGRSRRAWATGLRADAVGGDVCPGAGRARPGRAAGCLGPVDHRSAGPPAGGAPPARGAPRPGSPTAPRAAAGDARRTPRQVLAADGKVLRGARTQAGPVHLVAAYDQTAAVVVGQVAVDDGDEIAALPAVCDTLDDLQDVLVSADALHCQRSHATYLVGRGAHYVLTVKGNQRRLRDALARQPWATVPGLVQYDV